MNMTSESLLTFLTETLAVEDVGADSPLFSSGLLDSVTMLDLIAFIEKNAKIEVAQEDVTLENFDTVTRILEYARNKS